MTYILNIAEKDSRCQELIHQIEECESLAKMIWTIFHFVFVLGRKIVEAELAKRAQRATQWPSCPKCGKKLRSKGFVGRRIMTIFGEIKWKRRVGRCPNGCHIGQIAPLDQELGLSAYQSVSVELKYIACILAVFVPYQTAAVILSKLLPIQVNAMSIWKWVQQYGKIAIAKLDGELENLAQGILPPIEILSKNIFQLPLIIGADGVKVPFRAFGGSPIGKIVWREVKVGVLARLGQHIKRNGEVIPRLAQRRLVAVLGSIDILQPRLWLEALRQGVLEAKPVVWISDGGKGFWKLFARCFSSLAIGILDFYHAVQNLWKAAAAWLDGRTKAARLWFLTARHQLRHDSLDQILISISKALFFDTLSDDARRTLHNLYDYLSAHHEHTHYSLFKDLIGLPIGSGIVESACKWLIQQRFKGVGMRWSEEGFNNLLHLRLAWVNGRFDDLFFPTSLSPN